MMRPLAINIVVVLVLSFAWPERSLGAAVQQVGSSAGAAAPLTVTLTKSKGKGDLNFTVAFTNQSERIMALNLGRTVGGSQPDLAAIDVLVKGPSGQEGIWKQIMGGVVSGRMLPFVSLLPAHSSLLLQLDLRDYSAGLGVSGPDDRRPGVYQVRLEFKGEAVHDDRDLGPDVRYLTYLPYWSGTVISSPLTIVVRGARLGTQK